jgi:hypothetical protein
MPASQKTLPTGGDVQAFIAAVPDAARREDARRLCGGLGPHKTGKGCLYLKRLDDVNHQVLRQLVERTVRAHRGAHRASASA